MTVCCSNNALTLMNFRKFENLPVKKMALFALTAITTLVNCFEVCTVNRARFKDNNN